MKVTAVIAEYNPFHNGHAYQISRIREITGADYIIAIMSGNFVQRGIPAIYNKYDRCDSAIRNGIDLVLELPVIYATASAQYFSDNAVRLLDSLNCIDYLAFGMEHDNLEDFLKVAPLLLNETPEFKDYVRQCINEGRSVPYAISHAAGKILGSNIPDMSLSNNILALEYIKSLISINSTIKPVGIKRAGDNYNDTEIKSIYPSASAVRELIYSGDRNMLLNYYDINTVNKMLETSPVRPDDMSEIMNYSLLTAKSSLTEYLDCDEKFANRLNNILSSGRLLTFNELCLELKAKNYTYTRICRTLLHIILNIRKTDMDNPRYVKILGFNNNGRKLLRIMSDRTGIPVIQNNSHAIRTLPDAACRILEKDIYASDVYRIISNNKNMADEFRHKPVIY